MSGPALGVLQSLVRNLPQPFLVGRYFPGERRDRALAYDVFAHAAVGLDQQHIENSFLGNPQLLRARWGPVTTCLTAMCATRNVQPLPSDWALDMPGELVMRGLQMMRILLVLESVPSMVPLVLWLRLCASSQAATSRIMSLSNHADNYVGWCGQIWSHALTTWRTSWNTGTVNDGALQLEPLLLGNQLFRFMREEVDKLAVSIESILQDTDLLEVEHLDPWYKVMTRVAIPSGQLQGLVALSKFEHPLRGPLFGQDSTGTPFCWSVTEKPFSRIRPEDRPILAGHAGFRNARETDIILNPSIVITLAKRCRVSLATILPWQDGHFVFGTGSSPDSPGSVVRIRLDVGLFVELPAECVRDVATVKTSDVIEAIWHAGGEVRVDPTSNGSRFKIILHQTVNRLAQVGGGLGIFADALLTMVTSQPHQPQQGEVSFEMTLLVNFWGNFNALFVDSATAATTWPVVTGHSDILDRPTVVSRGAPPAGNLWTGGSQWLGQPYNPPLQRGAWRVRQAALMLLESVSLLNLAGLLWLAFTRKLDALVYVVVAANCIGEIFSRFLACLLAKRRAFHYLGALLSPVTWAVFEEGVRDPVRGRLARGILVLEAIPGVVGLGAALVGVGFEEVWSQVVIGIVAVASFFGSWGVHDFVQEIRGWCECRYDPEKMLLQAAMLYMTALIVEVAVLGPLFTSDSLALGTAIFGILEALVATFAIHRFVEASERLREALDRHASVTLPPPLSVRVGNLITGQGVSLAPTHHASQCSPVAYGNGRGAEEQREVVMGIGSNGLPAEVAVNEVLGVISIGRLSHVGSYTKMEDQRSVTTHVKALHWNGTLPPEADLAPAGLTLPIFARSLQSDPHFSVFVNRNVNLETTCCQLPLPPIQVLAPVVPGIGIAAVAVALPGGGVVLPYGANAHPIHSDGARVRGEPQRAWMSSQGISGSNH